MTGSAAARAGEATRLLISRGVAAKADAPLGALTTYRVGGRAAVLVTATTLADLAGVSDASTGCGLPVLVVGKGSNLLVADRGFAGIAVVLDPAGFGEVRIDGTTVHAGAAVALPALARRSVEAGLTGFEWAVGVPGSVGGAVRMNAGGHGSDIASCLVSCELVDLHGRESEPVRRSLADMHYGYRSSSIRPSEVVVAAELALETGDAERGRAQLAEIVRWRREHQPGGQNAGSVFSNPPGDSAGRLIDAAGLKGRRWGSAQVSPKHANFIQADRGGSADDVRRLMELVRHEVDAAQGVYLEMEVRIVGFDNSQVEVQVEGESNEEEKVD
jgi:UDP-N-acetylmuramate dehydrogenase